jgi:ribokinase
MGSSVQMIGCVGDDEHGAALVDALVSDGIDASGVVTHPTAPTGLAVITIDDSAENTIVVSPGANQELKSEHLTSDAISSAKVLLAQLEVPIETVTAAAAMATGIVCLNPAPSQSLPSELLDRVDVLIPNRTELADLSGVDHLDVARQIGFKGTLIVTLGSEGAAIVQDGSVVRVAAPVIEAVDPTGAGDAFCGAVAHGLAQGTDIESAVRKAVVAGAMAATRPGAQPSMPTASEVEAFAS